MAVAKAAMASGVARKPIADLKAYTQQLSARLDPTASSLQRIFDQVREQPKRVVFAEGEEERTIRAALAFQQAGSGTPVLVGREDRVLEAMQAMGLGRGSLEIHNARLSTHNAPHGAHPYQPLTRTGALT